MTIKRGGIAEPISGTIHTREIPIICPRCKIEKLGPRIYEKDELVAGGRIPYDHDRWRMCPRCGPKYVIAKHDIPQQGQLTTDLERITTKFQIQREDEHYKPPQHRRGFNERLDKGQDNGGIKDPELKRELKKGAKLISYSEK